MCSVVSYRVLGGNTAIKVDVSAGTILRRSECPGAHDNEVEIVCPGEKVQRVCIEDKCPNEWMSNARGFTEFCDAECEHARP